MKKFLQLSIPLLFSFSASFCQLVQNEGDLPVRIASFNIGQSNNAVLLNWRVICRVSFARFDIQRSANGTDFETIHSFQADKFRCQSPFEFTDQAGIPDAYYRIRVGDIDGNFSTERILHIKNNDLKTRFAVDSPVAGPSLRLAVASNTASKMSLKLFDANGRVFQGMQFQLPAGTTTTNWDIPSLPAGIYFISYSAADMHGVTRFVKL